MVAKVRNGSGRTKQKNYAAKCVAAIGSFAVVVGVLYFAASRPQANSTAESTSVA